MSFGCTANRYYENTMRTMIRVCAVSLPSYNYNSKSIIKHDHGPYTECNTIYNQW